MGQPAKQPDLTAARADVLAIIAGSAMSLRPPAAHASTPLRALPAPLEAKLASRAAAGLAPIGAGGPRTGTLRRVVGFVRRDPLRLTRAERRAIDAASRWESKRDWTRPLASSVERGLVVAATRAAERVAGSVTWRSGQIDEQRINLDLATELDQIDAQAHRIAVARREHGAIDPDTVPVLDAAWETTLTRVAALTAYADKLDGFDKRRAQMFARQGDPVRDSDLMAGSARDEMAADELLALTYFLNANLGDPLG